LITVLALVVPMLLLSAPRSEAYWRSINIIAINEIQVCRDGIRYQMSSWLPSGSPRPSYPGFTRPFLAYLLPPLPPGETAIPDPGDYAGEFPPGPNIANAELFIAPLDQPIDISPYIRGVELWYLGTNIVRWSQSVDQGAFVLLSYLALTTDSHPAGPGRINPDESPFVADVQDCLLFSESDTPGIPVDARAEANSYSQIDLTWIEALDDDGVDKYVIYRDGIKIGEVRADTRNAAGILRYSDTTVVMNREYTYSVQSIDVNGLQSELSESTMPTSSLAIDLLPVADAYVSYITGECYNNHADSILFVSGGTNRRDAYLKFSIDDLPGSISAATLSLRADPWDGHHTGFEIREVKNTDWNESTINCDNAPGIEKGIIGFTGAITSDTHLVAIDVTEIIPNRGLVSMALTTSDPDLVFIEDRNGYRPPHLTLDVSDTDSPSAPNHLKVEAFMADRVDLRWNAATDNFAVVGYTLYRDGVPLAIVPNDALQYSDTAVSTGMSYRYTVDAFDRLGNHSVQSASVAVTIPLPMETPAAIIRTWERTDKPVRDSGVKRTWMWGPESRTPAMTERYDESPDGMRTVQYYDKSRMEITDPNKFDDGLWYVSNGLLVVELMSGRLQLGDTTFEQRIPANVNVAGDPDDPTGPTYATLANTRVAPPLADGQAITQRIDRAGNVTDDPSLAAQGVTAAHHVQVPGIDHQVASPFWGFMNASGVVYQNGGYVTARLFINPFYATGFPITEAYWARVRVAGESREVLMQCFERRCLTYTPGNPEGWQVEAGNVGQHYYRWRYGYPPSASAGLETELATISP
jgi:hypothetical protein